MISKQLVPASGAASSDTPSSSTIGGPESGVPCAKNFSTCVVDVAVKYMICRFQGKDVWMGVDITCEVRTVEPKVTCQSCVKFTFPGGSQGVPSSNWQFSCAEACQKLSLYNCPTVSPDIDCWIDEEKGVPPSARK